MEIMDDLHITNDMFKEHLLDLCLDKDLCNKIQSIPTANKTAFTKEFNKTHKDITAVAAKKTKGQKVELIESESEEDDPMLDEEELEERQKAR